MTARDPDAGASARPGRHPAPPRPLLAWVAEFGGTESDPGEPLAAGVRALRTAMATAPDERRAAWALLAADALLTWAVEDAADAPDPRGALETVLRGAQLPNVSSLQDVPVLPEGKPGGMVP
jgi:hypothetical protein